MQLLNHLYCALRSRLNQLRVDGERDRGDSPVPTAVIIAGLVIVAMFVTAAAMTLADNWMDNIPEYAPPAAPGAGGN